MPVMEFGEKYRERTMIVKKIAVVTTTRAEYGLLHPVIKELRKFEGQGLFVELIVSGTHLSREYGYTMEEIEEAGDRIDQKIAIPTDSADPESISKNQAEALIKFTELFDAEKYNAVVLLGDRYEMLAVAVAAGNTRTPVFHIAGGDTTEGALDEWIRHSISKIAYLHFTTNEESRRRVIQLGEDPERVFNYGSTSIDNIITTADMSKAEALESIGLTEYAGTMASECRYALCTYHPVTNEGGDVEEQVNSLLSAIKYFPEIQFIVTKSNADQGGARINALLDEADGKIENLHVFTSLGVHRYLSLMKSAEFVLGNSSSGIIETPAFHVPTVNIGDRQRGRLQSESIINCAPGTQDIVNAIKLAMSDAHKAVCREVVSPYGDGHAAQRIAAKTVEVVNTASIDLKKVFYDIGKERTQ